MRSQKRKTLSDLTNTHNLIPTSTLRKLVAATTAAAASGSNSFSKPLISALRSNSSSTNQKLCSESSNRSDTSIGSSNVSVNMNSRTVQFRTPPRAASSVTSLGGVGSKDVAHNQSRITEKSKKRKEAPTSVEKRKDKGKDIAVPFSSSLPQRLDSNQNEVCSRANALERKKHKSEANLSLFGGPADMMKDSDKGVLRSYDGSYGKTGIGKAILKASGCAMGKQKGKCKGITNHPSCSIVKTSDRKKGILNGYGSSTLKRKDVEKEFVSPGFLVEKTKAEESPVNPVDYSYEKARDKGKAILQPSEIVAGTISRLPSRIRSDQWKNDPGASSSSCPPMKRTKNIQNDIYEAIPDIYGAGNFKFSKSWTDPHPICRKKRCSEIESSEVPLDFTEQQRTNLKEVDGTIICRPPRTRSEKLKNDTAASSSCPTVTRTKDIQNDIDEAGKFKFSKPWTDPHPICRKKRCSEIESSSELPLGFTEQQRTYLKEVDGICRPPRTRGEKLKNDTAASNSCPPVTKTKNIQNDTDEAEKLKSSKSWTDPNPKCRKKKGVSEKESSSELPRVFIEQQREYFKEVDDFELLEEEVSEDELD